MISNVYRKAYELVSSKTYGEMNDDEVETLLRILPFVANILPKLEPEYDTLPISEGLLRIARMIE